MIKDGKVLGRMGSGKAFGELAILYNCQRTASIKGELHVNNFFKEDHFNGISNCSSANSGGEVWVLERGVFQHIMMASGLQRLKDRIEFLRTVPLLADHKISEDQMLKLSDAFDLVGRVAYLIQWRPALG